MRRASVVQVFWATPRPPVELDALLDDSDRAYLRWLRDEQAQAESGTARALLRGAAMTELGRSVAITRDCVSCAKSHGRPVIDGLHVSASHTAGRVLVALSRACLIGVDVERVNATRFEGITFEGVHGLRATAQEWTRREAHFKSLGETSAFEHTTRIPDSGTSLDVGDGYAASLYVRGQRRPRIEVVAADDVLTAWATSPRTAMA